MSIQTLTAFVYLAVLCHGMAHAVDMQSEGRKFGLRQTKMDSLNSRPMQKMFSRSLQQSPERITITSGPSQNEVVGRNDFPIYFEVPGNAPTECLLQKGPDTIRDWFNCSSPLPLSETLESDGEYTLRIRIIGDPATVMQTEAVVTFTVDFVEPETVITYAGQKGYNGRTFVFEFEGVVDVIDFFECDLDFAKRWEKCSSPKVYKGLDFGPHLFAVRAVDIAGNFDSSPAKLEFEIETPSPTPVPVEPSLALQPDSPKSHHIKKPKRTSPQPSPPAEPPEALSPSTSPSALSPLSSSSASVESPQELMLPVPGVYPSPSSSPAFKNNTQEPDDKPPGPPNSEAGKANAPDDAEATKEEQHRVVHTIAVDSMWKTLTIIFSVSLVVIVIAMVICLRSRNSRFL